jgi:hypothetical protein
MVHLRVENGIIRNNSGTFCLVLSLEYQFVNANVRLFQANDNKIEYSKRVFHRFTQTHTLHFLCILAVNRLQFSKAYPLLIAKGRDMRVSLYFSCMEPCDIRLPLSVKYRTGTRCSRAKKLGMTVTFARLK